MQQPSILNRRTILLGITAIAVIVAVVLGIISLSRNVFVDKSKLTITSPFATNLAFTQQTDDRTLRFFTGSSFATYDLKSHKTTALTSTFALPATVTQVKWSNNAALIQAADYSENDQLYVTLARAGLDPNLDYWWLVNFKDNSIKLIGDAGTGATVSSAVWQSSDSFLYAEEATDLSNRVVNKSTLAQKVSAVATIPDAAALVSSTTTDFYYLNETGQASNLIAYNFASQKIAVAISDVHQILQTTADGSILTITRGKAEYDNENVSGQLGLYRPGQAVKALAPDFSGTAAWGPEHTWVALGHTSSSDTVALSGDAEKTTTYSLAIPDGSPKLRDYTTVGITKTGLLVTDTTTALRYAAPGTPSLPKLPDFSDISSGHAYDTFGISSPESNTYLVTITAAPYQENVDLAIDTLKAAGYDPLQLKLIWQADTGVNNGHRLPDELKPAITPDPVDIIDDNEGE